MFVRFLHQATGEFHEAGVQLGKIASHLLGGKSLLLDVLEPSVTSSVTLVPPSIRERRNCFLGSRRRRNAILEESKYYRSQLGLLAFCPFLFSGVLC